MKRVFVYDRLVRKEINEAHFGRKVRSEAAELRGYGLATIIATGEPTLIPQQREYRSIESIQTVKPESFVGGAVLFLYPDEAADLSRSYGRDSLRTHNQVRLLSGGQSTAFVHRWKGHPDAITDTWDQNAYNELILREVVALTANQVADTAQIDTI